MSYKSSERDRLLRRQQAIDFVNDLAEKKVGTDHASHANEKNDRTDCTLKSHLVQPSVARTRHSGRIVRKQDITKNWCNFELTGLLVTVREKRVTPDTLCQDTHD